MDHNKSWPPGTVLRTADVSVMWTFCTSPPNPRRVPRSGDGHPVYRDVVGGGEPVTVTLAPCGKAVARFVMKNGKPAVGILPQLSLVTRPRDGNVKADLVLVPAMDRVNYRGFLETDKQGRCTFPALIPGATYRFDALGLRSAPGFRVNPGQTLDLPDIVVDYPE